MQFGTLFSVHNPSKKAHPQNKIRAPRKAQILDTPCFFATLSQRNANLPRKARILDMPCFFATLSQRNAKTYPETAQISATPCFFATLSQLNAKNQPKNSRISYELHSLTPTTMPRKVLVFHNFTHRLKCIH